MKATMVEIRGIASHALGVSLNHNAPTQFEALGRFKARDFGLPLSTCLLRSGPPLDHDLSLMQCEEAVLAELALVPTVDFPHQSVVEHSESGPWESAGIIVAYHLLC